MNLNRDPRFKQGVFKPKHPQKFVGKFAVYRSSFELKFMRWADNNPNVLEWSSEQIIVPYVSPVDGRAHRYYVDNFVVIREGDVVKRYLVEIKPFGQTQPPKPSKRKKPATMLYEQTQWIINQAKWAAAREFARKKHAEFIILTEKELYAS
jgi:hypothetical protein